MRKNAPCNAHSLTSVPAVIKLKQIEHVRNERNVLAAVAGYSFIITMVASFQDFDTLYMLVS